MHSSIPSYDEIIEALSVDTPAAVVEGLTMREWRERWGLGRDKARSIVRQAVRDGLMVPQYKTIPCELLPGRTTTTVVYRYVPKKRGGK